MLQMEAIGSPCKCNFDTTKVQVFRLCLMPLMQEIISLQGLQRQNVFLIEKLFIVLLTRNIIQTDYVHYHKQF